MAESQSSKQRSGSMSQASESSQTAADYIKEQLSLEIEAREALPYQFDTCTRDLGPLKLSVYSCLTCNPPPSDDSDEYTPAGVCYSCSISCHGGHELVELFKKRNFVCDCGTARLPETSPCNLRIKHSTGQKGGVTGEEPAVGNMYNQNFRNKFCGCGGDYDPGTEAGTMFQCLGLGTVADGGCGEDWWHPECVLGIPRDTHTQWVEMMKQRKKDEKAKANPQQVDVAPGVGITREVSFTRTEETTTDGHPDARRPSIVTAIAAGVANGNGVDGNDIAAEDNVEDAEEEDERPPPPSFPDEDTFEYFLCYKCVQAHPWIKKYATAAGFVTRFLDPELNPYPPAAKEDAAPTDDAPKTDNKKRKASDDDGDSETLSTMAPPKRQKSVDPTTTLSAIPEDNTTTLPITPKKPTSTTTATTETDLPCKTLALPPLTGPLLTTPFSLFLPPSFFPNLCHCRNCFPLLTPHPQLLDEEDTYSPPVSRGGSPSAGTGSILDLGEAAFNKMDHFQAMAGAAAYAHLKGSLQAFFKPFAESGKAVGAEDIKAYFEKLRGDEQGIREAAGGARTGVDGDGDQDGDGGGDNRREQSGY